ncbi:MAG: hypothetical protein LAO31_00050 [Acidobacteriia bacterium]|nr:hypothetical protein [Terriglobia bacterium]
MRPGKIIVGLILLCGTSFAQNFSPQKDIVFGQVAAGGDYETVITLTNRGTQTYDGTLKFYQGEGKDWNPAVNGTPISDGKIPVSIPAGATVTYHVTGSGLLAGFACVMAFGQAQTNFVEGNLTYLIRSGAALVDSVGVPPSTEFYLSAIPFEDFSRIALALANGDSTNKTAKVTLTLYSETNANLGSTDLSLGPSWHTPKFLSQFFPSAQLSKGRIEIVSDIPIFGTALTLFSGQFSSLPLLPSQRAYTFVASAPDGMNFSGDASIWAEGPFVKGYIRVTTYNGSPMSAAPYLLYGRLINGTLMLFTWANTAPYVYQEGTMYLKIENFSFATNSYTTDWIATSVPDVQSGRGRITLTRVH